MMIFVAATLAVASGLHLSGNAHGSTPFDADHAGVAEAIIGIVLASAAIAMFPLLPPSVDRRARRDRLCHRRLRRGPQLHRPRRPHS